MAGPWACPHMSWPSCMTRFPPTSRRPCPSCAFNLRTSPIASRNRHETEEVIGLFVNAVILGTDLRGDLTRQEVLQRVRATALAAYARQDLPFEDLVQTLEGERGLKASSLCQVMVIMQNAMQRALQRS